jgi:creatinine amidohydrolase
MKLQLSTWPDVERYLEQSQGVVIPIGSTEQHGPTGLIGTDAICPETIAEGMSEAGILVAPTLSYGMAQHHLAFPGSASLRPSTLLAVVRDVVQSMAVAGFRKFYFLNGHGGNIATVSAAFSEVWAESSLRGDDSGLDMTLANWFMGKRMQALSAELYGDAEGFHATPSEISLTWHAYPACARTDRLQPTRGPGGVIREARNFRATFPDGRCASEPERASVEHGKRFYDAALADALEDYQRFLER